MSLLPQKFAQPPVQYYERKELQVIKQAICTKFCDDHLNCNLLQRGYVTSQEVIRRETKHCETLKKTFWDLRNLELVMHFTTLKCYIIKCTNLAWGENIEADPVHDMKAYKAPLIHDLSIRWRWVVNFRPQPLYLQYPLNGRPSNNRGSLDALARSKNLMPLPGIKSQIIQQSLYWLPSAGSNWQYILNTQIKIYNGRTK
jgi:hypothetical protein